MKNAALQVLASSIDTANNCSEHIDQILVLDNTYITQRGPHVEPKGPYANFVSAR
jgi:HEPN domain-containing protein